MLSLESRTPLIDIEALRQLQIVHFHPKTTDWDRYWTKRTPDEWLYLSRFLIDILSTSSLQEIDLDFYSMGNDDFTPVRSMASFLLANTWPNLQRLKFNGPFHDEELKAVVNLLGHHVDLHWCGYLMSGSWADILEFLRERNAPSQYVDYISSSVYSEEHGLIAKFSIYGQECQRMSKASKDSIFARDVVFESQASLYIQGKVPSNPVKEWEKRMINSTTE
ncbi:hypothetical protein F4808DRAFT_470519 [Astrocystis sublimbata]|nr:hypothetical protein F4808DRAFT_470519 [Astrocystis sublimbata]